MKNMKPRGLCTKIAGCPAFSCNEEECKQKTVKVHKAPRHKAKHHVLYNTAAWQSIRQQQLSAYPLCERCLGFDVVTPAVAVDHVQPHKGDRALFLDAGNRQSLCVSCHSHKTGKENAGVIEDYRGSRHKQEK